MSKLSLLGGTELCGVVSEGGQEYMACLIYHLYHMLFNDNPTMAEAALGLWRFILRSRSCRGAIKPLMEVTVLSYQPDGPLVLQRTLSAPKNSATGSPKKLNHPVSKSDSLDAFRASSASTGSGDLLPSPFRIVDMLEDGFDLLIGSEDADNTTQNTEISSSPMINFQFWIGSCDPTARRCVFIFVYSALNFAYAHFYFFIPVNLSNALWLVGIHFAPINWPISVSYGARGFAVHGHILGRFSVRA